MADENVTVEETAEFEAVKAVLIDRLHTTDDEELQAALWQLMAYHDELVRRHLNLKSAIRLMIHEGRQ